MFRTRRLSPAGFLSLLLYLGAVGFGVVDLALYGPDTHDHGGQPCPVHHFLNQSDNVDTPAAVTVAVPALRPAERLIPVSAPAVSGHDYPAYNSRAPPRIVFS